MSRVLKALGLYAAGLVLVAHRVNGQGGPPSINCEQAQVTVPTRFARGTVRINAPFVTTAGGAAPLTISPNPPRFLSYTGVAGTQRGFTYTARDARGNTATCTVVLQVVLGTPPPEPCINGDDVCQDPHMRGLRGQNIDWFGEDGAWYSLVQDEQVDLQINVRVTAPLPDDLPNRQLITGMSILSEGHSVIIAVNDPYSVDTDGCKDRKTPCLCDGGISVVVDGQDADGLLHPGRDVYVTDGITMSASNLPAECRQFGGDKIWARMYDEMLQGRRQLAPSSFEDWILSYGNMAALDWCARFIDLHGIDNVQSSHAVFQIVTPTVLVRLNAGLNHQGGGELDSDGRVLPELDFWQMDIGLEGLSVHHESLSGLLGETARPVIDDNGSEVMDGYDAFRGTVEDYKVVDALGTDFALLRKKSLLV